MKKITEKTQELLDMEAKLHKLLEYSYCPYSNFKVSAIVSMKDGTEFGGVNVENAAYGSTICAERSAIYTAISNGYKRGDFASLYCLDSSDSDIVSAPCGSCLQVISEFFEQDARFIFINIKNKITEYTLKEMLPFSFTVDDLLSDNSLEKNGTSYTKK
jgi:cytidine deaminase